MLRKLVMAACCVALGGIALATMETATNANGKATGADVAAAATNAPAKSISVTAASSASPGANSASATRAAEAIASKNANAPEGASAIQAQSSGGAQNGRSTPSAAEDIPAHHETAPKDPLPETLDPAIFPDVINQNIYALAAKEKKVLYQQPCYCRCDHEVGHKSLLDCYVDRHASVCSVCKMEAVFAYQETKKGKTPAQIREEIIQGKWKTADLTSYQTPGAVTPETKPETK